MAYDNTCKFIAEHFPSDLAIWLLGQPFPLTKLEPTELSVDPIRGEALVQLHRPTLLEINLA